MKKLDASINTPGRMTMLAVLVAGLVQTGFATAAVAVPIPNHLVISQVYPGGGNGSDTAGNTATYKLDFVEVFNPTGDTVDLSTWSLQYSATGNTGNFSGIAKLSGNIAPGKYKLFAMQGGTAGIDLPNPDAVASGAFNMAAAGGKVALSKTATVLTGANPVSADIVDFIGWGTANGAEGTAAPAPSGTTVNRTSIQRASAGCADSDNNAIDFTVAAVAPRNRDTAALSCTGAPPVAAIIPSCPANFALNFGSAGVTALSASDTDSIVNSAIISSGATAGISIANFVASTANGVSATASLSVASTVPVGTYSIGILFGNDSAQTASCTVSVAVQAPAGAVTHTIAQVQGSGTAASPVNNQVVTIEGVVTLKNAAVYAIQSKTPNGDPTKSDGILIYNAPPAGLLVGDLVRVTGTVSDYQPDPKQHPYTEITKVTATAVQSHGNVITPVNVAYADIRSGNYDSMVVNILDTLTVQQTESLAGYGEVSLAMGRKEIPTNQFRPGSTQAIAMRAANDANGIVLDDGLSTAPTSVPYLAADKTLRAGDSATGLTGILDFGSIGTSIYGPKLQPTATPVFSRSNPRTDVPSLPVGNVKVASANVLNFFTVFTNGSDVNGATGKGCFTGTTTVVGNCRGADNLPEFIRQRDKIVNELKAIDADVFGLMEIQNDGDTTVTYLVNQLNAAIGSTTYAVVPKPPSTGTDAIRVAMIYKPSKLTLAGPSQSDADSVNNRPPFAQTFSAANGGKFSLIVNHMKSKSCSGATGANADSGDGQSCYNSNRVAQATRLTSFFIPQVVSNGGTPNVLVVGDLNSYGMEDPIKVITDSGMVNQLERLIRPNGMPYSFVFNNETGYLDHALASASLSPQVIGAAEWHNNADEPTAIDYNFDGKPGGSDAGVQTDPSKDTYVNNAYRASDHDPVIVSLALTGTSTDVTGSFQTLLGGAVLSRATGKYTAKYTFQNNTGSTITGPFKVQLAGLTSGVTLDGAAGMYNGSPYAAVSNASVAPGETVTLTLIFTNPGKIVFNFTPTIFTGNF